MANYEAKEAIETVDELFMRSMGRIKAIGGSESRYMLGLSGGYDSRLTLHYALKHWLNVECFCYSHGPESDAVRISKKIAEHYGKEVRPVFVQNEMRPLFEKHIDEIPMHNISYASHCAVETDFPEADQYLSGTLGGELFGNHIRRWDTDENMSLADKILKRCLLRHPHAKLVSQEIWQGMRDDAQAYEEPELPAWRSCEIFEYECRQRRFIKDSPMYDLYGKYPLHMSPFVDIDLVDYVRRMPHEALFGRTFYDAFHKNLLPEVSRIRGERQPFTLYDPVLLRKTKSKLLRLRHRVYIKYGVLLPIFKEIEFVSHFDFPKMYKAMKLDNLLENIEIDGIRSEVFLDLPDDFFIHKYLYLTLQLCVKKYIDREELNLKMN